VAKEEIKAYRAPNRSRDSLDFWCKRLSDPHFQEETLNRLLGNPGLPAGIMAGIVLYIIWEFAPLLLSTLSNLLGILSGVPAAVTQGVEQTKDLVTGKARDDLQKYKPVDSPSKPPEVLRKEQEDYNRAWDESEKTNPIGTKLLKLYSGMDKVEIAEPATKREGRADFNRTK